MNIFQPWVTPANPVFLPSKLKLTRYRKVAKKKQERWKYGSGLKIRMGPETCMTGPYGTPFRTGSIPGQEISRINNMVKTSTSLEAGIHHPKMVPKRTGNTHVRGIPR